MPEEVRGVAVEKRTRRGADPLSPGWTPDDAVELYQVDAWSGGYFSINASGHLVVRPDTTEASEIDLSEVLDHLRASGLDTPILLRFDDVLAHRLRVLHDAFATARAENEFDGDYLSVYPIKVNQQRPSVERVLRSGAHQGSGIEVGSKPELLAAVALTAAAPGRLILCNGFKDDAYIETVILASKLGRNIIPIIEKPADFALILEHARRHEVDPRFGVRIKLASQGAGRWQDSSGERSKFGLFMTELVDMLGELRRQNLLDALQLLHCHAGSQIQDIRRLKNAVSEIAHVYCELAEAGAGLRYIDVGGGLGVDYDGSRTNYPSSMNYTLQEYASEVVYRIATVCNERGVTHPTVITESGRATAAYHAVLVVSALGSTGPSGLEVRDVDLDFESPDAGEELASPIRDLVLAYESVEPRRVLECYHDAAQAREQALNLFNLGYLSVDDRARVERLFWATCRRVAEVGAELEPMPDELSALSDIMVDTYFCNFSLFQSLPDSWAIGQLFPILPLHRLDEAPTRRAVLADLTCDSDGRIDRFVDVRDVKRTLALHELVPGESYDLAACLVGAYQETLGAMHNLFGDAHSVHIATDTESGWRIEEVVRGDRARDVLSYSQYDVECLLASMSEDCASAVTSGRITEDEGRYIVRSFSDELEDYTYLRRGTDRR